MLSLEALNSSKDLVAVLADKGVTLRAVGNTPLAEAMMATKVWGNNIDCLSKIDELPDSLFRNNESQFVNGEVRDDVHTAYQEAASSALGIQLASHIAYATTVVLPVVGELHNAIKNVQDLESQCGIRSYKVEMVSGSSLLDVGDLVSKIEGFGSLTVPTELPFVLDFKQVSDEELINLMKIGAQVYDDAVDQFVAQAGMVNVREVWDVVFSGENRNYDNYDVFRSTNGKGEIRNFTTFLLASKLMANLEALPDVTGLAKMSSSKYPLALRALMEVSGASLFTLLAAKRNEEKQGKLIAKIAGKVVYVNKAVYDRYMADGGDIETILGSVVSGGKSMYVSDLADKVEEFKQAWAYHVTRSKMTAGTNELVNVRVCIANFIRQFLMTTDDRVIVDNRSLIEEQLGDYLERIYKGHLADVDTLALKTVCEVLFNHSDALSVLCGVTEAMTANPDISKEDALNLSVTDYVAKWFASQIEIS